MAMQSMPTVSYWSMSCATGVSNRRHRWRWPAYAMADVDHIGVVADRQAHRSHVLAQGVRLLHPMQQPLSRLRLDRYQPLPVGR
jgi:hypothetical protein